MPDTVGDLNGGACNRPLQKNAEKDRAGHEDIRSGEEGDTKHGGEICHGCPERCHRYSEDLKEENRDGGRHKGCEEAVGQNDLIVWVTYPVLVKMEIRMPRSGQRRD